MERRIEARRSGTLLDHEAAGPELLRASAAYERREHTNMADTLRAARRRDGASQSRAFDVGLAGCTVFTRCTGPSIGWINDLNLQKVGLHSEATLFVVDDIVKPGHRILWVAGLTGGCITRPGPDQWLVYKTRLGLATVCLAEPWL